MPSASASAKRLTSRPVTATQKPKSKPKPKPRSKPSTTQKSKPTPRRQNGQSRQSTMRGGSASASISWSAAPVDCGFKAVVHGEHTGYGNGLTASFDPHLSTCEMHGAVTPFADPTAFVMPRTDVIVAPHVTNHTFNLPLMQQAGGGSCRCSTCLRSRRASTQTNRR
jgi:hypothetical protein